MICIHESRKSRVTAPSMRSRIRSVCMQSNACSPTVAYSDMLCVVIGQRSSYRGHLHVLPEHCSEPWPKAAPDSYILPCGSSDMSRRFVFGDDRWVLCHDNILHCYRCCLVCPGIWSHTAHAAAGYSRVESQLCQLQKGVIIFHQVSEA